jgi:hypothetical protein
LRTMNPPWRNKGRTKSPNCTGYGDASACLS